MLALCWPLQTTKQNLVITAGITSLNALKTYFGWLNKGAQFHYDKQKREWIYSQSITHCNVARLF